MEGQTSQAISFSDFFLADILTSMSKVLRTIDVLKIKPILIRHFAGAFGFGALGVPDGQQTGRNFHP